MRLECSVEKVDNGFILKTNDWGLSHTEVYKTFEELIDKIAFFYGQRKVGELYVGTVLKEGKDYCRVDCEACKKERNTSDTPMEEL